jgi:hypothetical protein
MPFGGLLTLGIIGAGTGIFGSVMGANAAGNAADTQAAAAQHAADLQYKASQEALGFQKQVWGTQQQQLAPWVQTGQGALGMLAQGVGMSAPAGTAPAAGGAPATSPPAGAGPPATPPAGYPAGQPWPPTGSATGAATGATAPATGAPPAMTGEVPGGAGSLMTPFGEEFNGGQYAFNPNSVDVLAQDPGYQFRLSEGQKALEHSASARGGALGGRAGKELARYGQDYASNEYGNAYNRAFQENQVGYNRAFQEYQNRYNIYNQEQGNQFNRLASLAGMGQTGVNQLNSAGTGFANAASQNVLGTAANVGNYLTQGANAQAAGMVGSANAWNSGLSGMSSSAQNMYLMNMLFGNQNPTSFPGTTYGGGGSSISPGGVAYPQPDPSQFLIPWVNP